MCQHRNLTWWLESTTEAVAPVASTSRPSSPLGRLTELFTSKKGSKKGKSVATEEQEAPATVAAVTEEQADAAAVAVKEDENKEEAPKKEDIEATVKDTNVTDVASPAVVTASA